MGLFRSFVFFLLLHLLQGSNASLIQLVDNGYENVIISIDPDVPESEALIEKIKEMVTEASTYLFEATEKRMFFKNVSILIPEKWTAKPQYKRPRHESYKHADVKITSPVIPGRDEPYTRQFTECGEKGEFIHLTPDFVLGKKQNEYGPSGRLLVHEWAHLRWGVFDEYNDEEPFYAAKSKRIEATRCTTGITGVNRVYTCQGGSCTDRLCKVDSKTKLYEKDCQFFPDQDQIEKASIMYMQAIDSVTEFCNKKTHNREAPSLQNKKCNSRSTWEVISISEDFKNTISMMTSPPPPAFSLLRISERTVCLVLDISGSMSGYDRLNRMNQAAKHFLLEIIEDKSWVGLVVFESSASIKSHLIQITSKKERETLTSLLPTTATGGTSICSGMDKAIEVIQQKYTQLDGSEIVLLTDGEDSAVSSCIDRVVQSGAVVHSIALGPKAAPEISTISNMTGGKNIYASDAVQNNGLIDAFAALTSENTDIFQQPFQLESRGLELNNREWLNGTVTIDSTVGKSTSFLITWENLRPTISIWDPSGTLMQNLTEDTASKMVYLHIPGTAMVGPWTYSLQANANLEKLAITVNSRAANSSVPPITVNAKMNKDTNSFPSPMIVYAEVLQGFTPVLGANVTAIIESQNGKTENLQLLDNGAGADAFKNDGVYSRYFTAYSENGRYSLKVHAYAEANAATRSFRHPLNRAAFIPGWVVNGKIEANPPRPEIDDETQTILESFSRKATGGAFVVDTVPLNPSQVDQFPPSQISDLKATREEDEITLTWTAPGDNFDEGTVQQYIIRISGNILDLKDNFDSAQQVNTTDLSPKEANSQETFVFKQGNITEENATYIFIAIQSVDKSNLTSEVSNIAQVALFIPESDPTPDPSPTPDGNHTSPTPDGSHTRPSPNGSHTSPTPDGSHTSPTPDGSHTSPTPDGSHTSPTPDGSQPNSRLSVTAVVLIVVGCVAAVCIIIGITVCVLKKKRKSSRAGTMF